MPIPNEAISVCWPATGPGCSANRAPNARYIVEPVDDREKLIVADLNLNEIDQEFLTLDVSGHYPRSDVLTFETKAQ